MKNFKSGLYILLFLSLSLALSACDTESSDTKDLTVSWNISDMKVCKTHLTDGQYSENELEFDHVEINIYEDESMETAIQEPITVACSTYDYKITRLDAGKYFVKVDAYTTYDDKELAFFTGSSEVKVPSDENEIDITLAIGSGNVEVQWRFGDGQICGIEKAGEVKFVVVSLDDDTELTTPCGDGIVKFENVEPKDNYTITAVALDEDKNVLYDSELADNPVSVLPGQEFEAIITFK